jgi:uncharacterized protein
MSQSIVSAQDMIEESKRRGYLAKQLYVVFTSPANGIGPVMENVALSSRIPGEAREGGHHICRRPERDR